MQGREKIYGEYCKLLPEREAGCSPAEKSSGAGTGIRAQVQSRSNTVREVGDFFADETAKSYQQEYGNASGIRNRDYAALGNLHVKRPLQEYQKEPVSQGKQPEQQHQVQRPSAYHENTIKTTGAVLHRKSDVPFSIKWFYAKVYFCL